MAAHGFTAPETGRAYERALELTERIGDLTEMFPVLYGLCLYQLYGADLAAARLHVAGARGQRHLDGRPGVLGADAEADLASEEIREVAADVDADGRRRLVARDRAAEDRRIVRVRLDVVEVVHDALIDPVERGAAEHGDLRAAVEGQHAAELHVHRQLLPRAAEFAAHRPRLIEEEGVRHRRVHGRGGRLREARHADADGEIPPQDSAARDVERGAGADGVIGVEAAVLRVLTEALAVAEIVGRDLHRAVHRDEHPAGQGRPRRRGRRSARLGVGAGGHGQRHQHDQDDRRHAPFSINRHRAPLAFLH